MPSRAAPGRALLAPIGPCRRRSPSRSRLRIGTRTPHDPPRRAAAGLWLASRRDRVPIPDSAAPACFRHLAKRPLGRCSACRPPLSARSGRDRLPTPAMSDPAYASLGPLAARPAPAPRPLGSRTAGPRPPAQFPPVPLSARTLSRRHPHRTCRVGKGERDLLAARKSESAQRPNGTQEVRGHGYARLHPHRNWGRENCRG